MGLIKLLDYVGIQSMTVLELPESLHPLDDSFYDIIESREVYAFILHGITTLKENEQKVLNFRLGLDGPERTLQSIALEFHRSRECVRRIEAEALRKLSKLKELKTYFSKTPTSLDQIYYHIERATTKPPTAIHPKRPDTLPAFYARWSRKSRKTKTKIKPLIVSSEFIINNLPAQKVGATWVSDQKAGKFVLARMEYLHRIVDRLLAIGYERIGFGCYANKNRIVRLHNCIGHTYRLWIHVAKRNS